QSSSSLPPKGSAELRWCGVIAWPCTASPWRSEIPCSRQFRCCSLSIPSSDSLIANHLFNPVDRTRAQLLAGQPPAENPQLGSADEPIELIAHMGRPEPRRDIDAVSEDPPVACPNALATDEVH